jgi:uncharacterized membrane protein
MKREFWHNLGMDLADRISGYVGSWAFIIIQSVILTFWIIANVKGWTKFDPYPFILLNLFLSFQAAYATPMILISSNRQADRDREKAAKYANIEKETNVLMKETLQILSKVDSSIEMMRETIAQHEELLAQHEFLIKTEAELKASIGNVSKKADQILKKLS